jgi:hypothetical protein
MELRSVTEPEKDYDADDQRRKRGDGGAICVEFWRHASHFIA